MFKKLFKIVVLLVLILWAGGYAVFIYNIPIKTLPNTSNKTDAIVVLTGGSNRIQTGLHLFSDKISPILFITGVHPSVKKEELTALWKGKTMLPECCIILGHIATTTLENAIETKSWLNNNDSNIKSIRLVTSAYHMQRAILEFKNKIKDVNIIAHPVEDQLTLKDIKLWKLTFSEYNKILVRRVIIAVINKGQT